MLYVALAFSLMHTAATGAEWRSIVVPVLGRVTAIERSGLDSRVVIGQHWYRVAPDAARLDSASPLDRPKVSAGALPDARVAIGRNAVFRAWLAEPTARYRHGVLGDAIEAGSLVLERADGRLDTLRLGQEAVFEDIEPRIATLNGVERIILVKSYIDRGSALAIIDTNSATIIAETPPIGHANAWLNPAGIADFDGDGVTDIALVRQPHVVGRLELWSMLNGKLRKTAEVPDVSNHFIGSRALDMSFTADFDGDSRPDLAVPSLDRQTLRLIGITPKVRDIARIQLPARIATNIGAIIFRGRLSLVFGLESGQLVLVHD